MQEHVKVWMNSRGVDGTESYNNCERCGSNKGVDVHHIVSRRYKETNTPWNLIMLCRDCHVWAHSNNNQMGKESLLDLIRHYY